MTESIVLDCLLFVVLPLVIIQILTIVHYAKYHRFRILGPWITSPPFVGYAIRWMTNPELFWTQQRKRFAWIASRTDQLVGASFPQRLMHYTFRRYVQKKNGAALTGADGKPISSAPRDVGAAGGEGGRSFTQGLIWCPIYSKFCLQVFDPTMCRRLLSSDHGRARKALHPNRSALLGENHLGHLTGEAHATIKDLVKPLLNSKTLLQGSFFQAQECWIGSFWDAVQAKPKEAFGREHLSCLVSSTMISILFGRWVEHTDLEEDTNAPTSPAAAAATITTGEERINEMQKLFEIFHKGLDSVPFYFPGTALFKAVDAKKALLHIITGIVHHAATTLLSGGGPGSGPQTGSHATGGTPSLSTPLTSGPGGHATPKTAGGGGGLTPRVGAGGTRGVTTPPLLSPGGGLPREESASQPRAGGGGSRIRRHTMVTNPHNPSPSSSPAAAPPPIGSLGASERVEEKLGDDDPSVSTPTALSSTTGGIGARKSSWNHLASSMPRTQSAMGLTPRGGGGGALITSDSQASVAGDLAGGQASSSSSLLDVLLLSLVNQGFRFSSQQHFLSSTVTLSRSTGKYPNPITTVHFTEDRIAEILLDLWIYSYEGQLPVLSNWVDKLKTSAEVRHCVVAEQQAALSNMISSQTATATGTTGGGMGPSPSTSSLNNTPRTGSGALIFSHHHQQRLQRHNSASSLSTPTCPHSGGSGGGGAFPAGGTTSSSVGNFPSIVPITKIINVDTSDTPPAATLLESGGGCDTSPSQGFLALPSQPQYHHPQSPEGTRTEPVVVVLNSQQLLKASAYTRQCIWETIRLHPPVSPVPQWTTLTNFAISSDCSVPKETIICPNLAACCRRAYEETSAHQQPTTKSPTTSSTSKRFAMSNTTTSSTPVTNPPVTTGHVDADRFDPSRFNIPGSSSGGARAAASGCPVATAGGTGEKDGAQQHEQPRREQAHSSFIPWGFGPHQCTGAALAEQFMCLFTFILFSDPDTVELLEATWDRGGGATEIVASSYQSINERKEDEMDPLVDDGVDLLKDSADADKDNGAQTSSTAISPTTNPKSKVSPQSDDITAVVGSDEVAGWAEDQHPVTPQRHKNDEGNVVPPTEVCKSEGRREDPSSTAASPVTPMTKTVAASVESNDCGKQQRGEQRREGSGKGSASRRGGKKKGR